MLESCMKYLAVKLIEKMFRQFNTVAVKKACVLNLILEGVSENELCNNQVNDKKTGKWHKWPHFESV